MKLSRREAMLSLAAFVGSALPSPTAMANSASQFPCHLLIDTRIKLSAGVVARANARSSVVHAFAGDVSSVWFTSLIPALRAGSSVIVGMTDRAALFCFEHLAWNEGLRLQFRIDHYQSNEEYFHVCKNLGAGRLRMPPNDDVPIMGRNFFDLLAESEAAWRPICNSSAAIINHGPGQHFVSWVMAPAHRRDTNV
ncbi:MAG: hypothetical protein R3C51_12140 [Parvularculaceae bacterium]